ncbi:MAG TPA: ankyrin repeat domain-containing protein [Chthonomonadaceae bacterium]|nr:ankyrin repeat domain-containing protein [Chthonomonadaceae bacterium]
MNDAELRRRRRWTRCILPAAVIVCVAAGVWLARFRPLPPGQPLIRAVKRGDVALVRRLLAQGMDPNTEDGEPASHGAGGYLWGMGELFVSHRLPQAALAVALDYDYCYDAAGKRKPEPKEIVDALLERHADPRARCAFGDSLVMQAASLGYAHTVRALVARGASVHDQRPDGTNAMQGAIGSGDIETVKAIVEGGWKVNALEVQYAAGFQHPVIRNCLASAMARQAAASQKAP